jgi:hypothetical protein
MLNLFIKCLVLVEMSRIIAFGLDENSLLKRFKLCDTNKNDVVSKDEWQTCIKHHNSHEDAADVMSLFKDLDKNRDGSLHLEEFMGILTSATVPGDINIITRDGLRKSVSQEEFMRLSEENKKGLHLENGQLTRTVTGSAKIEDIPDSDKEIKKYAYQGQWAHRNIVESGYASGELINMRSIVTDKTSRDSYLEEYLKLDADSELQVHIYLHTYLLDSLDE